MGLVFATGVLERCLDSGEKGNIETVEVIVERCAQLYVDLSKSDIAIANMII